MTYQPATLANNSSTLPKLPEWTTPKSGETPQNIAFLSGASFVMLDVVLQQSGDTIPRKLLANSLVLKATVATSKLEGRLAREADIRDGYHLTPPGADGVRHWGPDGVLSQNFNLIRTALIAEHSYSARAANCWKPD